MASAQETDVESSNELSAIIQKKRLQQALDQLTAVVDEAILRIGRDGLEVAAVNPANVAMVDIHLTEQAFEAVGAGKFPIGTNLHKLNDHLKHADAGQLIELTYKPETRYLNIHYGNTDVDLAAIDPDSIRSEPDLPDIDITASATLGSNAVEQAVKQSDLVSDHIKFTADPGQGELIISAKGDTDNVTIRFDRDDLDDGHFETDVMSLYSIDYVSTVLAETPSDAALTLEFATERPLQMHYELADGTGTALTCIAPRIVNE